MRKSDRVELKQLRYFTHVAEFGSFTRASNHLDISASVLSRQIRQLEVDLGKNLLIRDGRGVTLTESGYLFLEHCRKILTQLEKAVESVSGAELAGNVSLGFPPTLARYFSVPIIRTFHELMPKAKLRVIEESTVSIEEGIITGRIDMGLIYNPVHMQDLDAVFLLKESLYLIAPRSMKIEATEQGISLAKAAVLPLILPAYPNGHRRLIETEMIKLACKPNLILEVNSVRTTFELVAKAMGCTIFSSKGIDLLPKEEQKNIQMHRIHSTSLITNLYIATSNKRVMTNTEETLSKIIASLCLEYFAVSE
ncbi:MULTISPECIES: LysR family transcriptional regulator [Ignatzschineria]|uniref:LysR family transcriptional regulator n=1 Tax=Ignatzschineria cameli TaxID=2182793 RepID=A0A2U2ATS9_9GAMM|nr:MULTISPECIES: LysR family transcriptional regulator [Ignatzschineria]OYQ78049.1 hypothetical protein B9T19_08245 [Ignatzschineria sp. F8392]PWD87376.1 LysR family transcriptional regulator [Ignatzschineria cameli]PWD88131.1 LysR family transcriptional regulator [Ignatzschineria cameli]PWD91161.1 LysR family transcriptional regulator [Ignatzschineria cameli]PWD92802.1 LysR family transcriptional regulator [Ignatzschineria cameli]